MENALEILGCLMAALLGLISVLIECNFLKTIEEIEIENRMKLVGKMVGENENS